jgi:hypothetical protein
MTYIDPNKYFQNYSDTIGRFKVNDAYSYIMRVYEIEILPDYILDEVTGNKKCISVEESALTDVTTDYKPLLVVFHENYYLWSKFIDDCRNIIDEIVNTVKDSISYGSSDYIPDREVALNCFEIYKKGIMNNE